MYVYVYVYVCTDARIMHYLPSVVATATILFAIKDFEPSEVMQYEIQVMSALKVSKVSFLSNLLDKVSLFIFT